MKESSQPWAEGTSAPPHPFRAPAWYDPRLTHQPCLCPRCRPPRQGPELRPLRIMVVVACGVLWPLAALFVNAIFLVVELGTCGHLGLLLAVAATLANLVLCPSRRDPSSGRVEVRAPRASWLRAVLLLGSLWGCLVWGYLGLLMLPLLPLSLIAIIWQGLGLCGLTPFVALGVSLVQARRAVAVTTQRVGRPATALLVAAGLLLPPLVCAGAGFLARRRQAWLEAELGRIAGRAPHSEQRLTAIAGLAGRERWLPALYPKLRGAEEQRAAAEAYLLLTDERINEPVARRFQQERALIRPLWFLDGRHPAASLELLRFGHLVRF